MFKFCSKNSSIGIFDVGLESFSVKKNQITGFAGGCLDRIMCALKDRKCELVGAPGFGNMAKNGSITDGALKLLMKKRISLYLNPEFPVYINPLTSQWLRMSNPAADDRYYSVQSVYETENNRFFDLLKNFKFSFLFNFLFLLSLISSLAFYLMLVRIERGFKRPNIRLFLRRFLRFTRNRKVMKRASLAGMFMFAFHLFLIVMRALVTNNIRTNKLVLDTSYLIESKSDLLATDKVHCFAAGLAFLDVARSSPKGTFLRRVYDQKSNGKQGKCIVDPNAYTFDLDPRDIFSLLSERMALTFLAQLSKIFPGQTVFVNQKKVYFEASKVLYFNDDERVKSMAIIVQMHVESGLFEEITNCIRRRALQISQQNAEYFLTIESLIKNRIRFSNLELENFQQIFQIHFLFNVTVLVIFIGWLSLRSLRMIRIRMRRVGIRLVPKCW